MQMNGHTCAECSKTLPKVKVTKCEGVRETKWHRTNCIVVQTRPKLSSCRQSVLDVPITDSVLTLLLGSAVVSGKRLPYEEASAQSDSEDEDSLSDSDDSEAGSSPKTELAIRLSNIRSTIDHLYKLSFKIRNPALRPRTLKATLYEEPVDLTVTSSAEDAVTGLTVDPLIREKTEA